MKERELTFVDLFAGCGGFGLGFEMAGAKQLLAVECDKWAAESHAYNFPHVSVETQKIERLCPLESSKKFGESIDLIIGGPPCQGFSHANVVNKDPKDPRNTLFRYFSYWVETLRPKMFVMENVPALLKTTTSDGELVIDIITKNFLEIGYQVQIKVLNAKNFGVPQNRPRLFIIGGNSELQLGERNWFPQETHSENIQQDLFFQSDVNELVTLWDAISDLPQYTHSDYNPDDTYRCSPQNNFQELMRRRTNGFLYNSEPMRHTARIIERFKQIKIGESEADVHGEFVPAMRNSINGAKSVKTYAQNSRRQHPNRPCNTVVASSHSNFIHPFLDRNFTVRELLRIQSFPDHFRLMGKRAVLSKKLSIKKGLLDDIYLDQRMQVGNAVPPLLAKCIADNLIELLQPLKWKK